MMTGPFLSALVQASFINYSISVCMNRMDGSVVGARLNIKQELEGVANTLQLYSISWTTPTMNLQRFLNTTEKPQQWNVASTQTIVIQFVFKNIICVTHIWKA